jgi:hypothetical protein
MDERLRQTVRERADHRCEIADFRKTRGRSSISSTSLLASMAEETTAKT